MLPLYIADRREAVVAVGTDIDRMCHIGPEDAAADINILRASPVPPAVIVQGYAVVTGAQETVFNMHTATAHQVDA